jgi:hypothetical protein
MYDNLFALKADLRSAADARLRSEFGLPLRCFEGMSAIDRLGSCRVEDVATELVIGGGKARKLISQLGGEGYCRYAAPGDEASRVKLTPTGRTLVTAAGLAFDDELEQFAAALKRFRRPGIFAVSSTSTSTPGAS